LLKVIGTLTVLPAFALAGALTVVVTSATGVTGQLTDAFAV